MNIDSIQNGIVIDHITAGRGMKLYELLGLEKLDCSVAIIKNVHSVKLGEFVPQTASRYALVFGNEVDGVDQEVVDAADFALEIPQKGTKHSLNVSVSVGVVLWEMVRSR